MKHLSKIKSILGCRIARKLIALKTCDDFGISWSSRKHPSGAVTFFAFVPANPVVGGMGESKRYYVRLPSKDIVNRWATLIVANKKSEDYRCVGLKILDDICKPLVGRKKFIKWVTKMEVLRGESCYKTMTVEQISGWIQAVNDWESKNK